MKAKFAVNDQVLVRHGVSIYDAKILQIDPDSEVPHYFVHYMKWNKKWDEWVSPERILDTSEASRELQRQSLIDAAAVQKTGTKKRIVTGGVVQSTSNGKKRKTANPFDSVKPEASSELENFVGSIDMQIPIPVALKKILVDDWKFVTQKDCWIDLPRKVTVASIVHDFLSQEDLSEKQAAERESTQEVIKGLQTYFDKAAGLLLIYKFERQQHDALVAAHPNKPLSEIYGGEHLLRLFVRLPVLLSDVNGSLSQQESQAILNTMVGFLKFIQKRKQHYLQPAYVAAAEFPLPTPAAKDEPTKETVSEEEEPKEEEDAEKDSELTEKLDNADKSDTTEKNEDKVESDGESKKKSSDKVAELSEKAKIDATTEADKSNEKEATTDENAAINKE